MTTKTTCVHNKMQKGYSYTLTEPLGKNFDPRLNPNLPQKAVLFSRRRSCAFMMDDRIYFYFSQAEK